MGSSGAGVPLVSPCCPRCPHPAQESRVPTLQERCGTRGSQPGRAAWPWRGFPKKGLNSSVEFATSLTTPFPVRGCVRLLFFSLSFFFSLPAPCPANAAHRELGADGVAMAAVAQVRVWGRTRRCLRHPWCLVGAATQQPLWGRGTFPFQSNFGKHPPWPAVWGLGAVMCTGVARPHPCHLCAMMGWGELSGDVVGVGAGTAWGCPEFGDSEAVCCSYVTERGAAPQGAGAGWGLWGRLVSVFGKHPLSSTFLFLQPCAQPHLPMGSGSVRFCFLICCPSDPSTVGQHCSTAMLHPHVPIPWPPHALCSSAAFSAVGCSRRSPSIVPLCFLPSHIIAVMNTSDQGATGVCCGILLPVQPLRMRLVGTGEAKKKGK